LHFPHPFSHLSIWHVMMLGEMLSADLRIMPGIGIMSASLATQGDVNPEIRFPATGSKAMQWHRSPPIQQRQGIQQHLNRYKGCRRL
jgi:hypothetical protein